MSSLFKSFGKGLLYVVIFPALVAGIALYAVFGLFVFIFQLGKLIYLFFTGRTLFSDYEEDIAAKAKLSKNEEESKESELSLYPSDSPVYTSNYVSPTFDDKKEENPSDDELAKEEEEANDDF